MPISWLRLRLPVPWSHQIVSQSHPKDGFYGRLRSQPFVYPDGHGICVTKNRPGQYGHAHFLVSPHVVEGENRGRDSQISGPHER